MKVETKLLEEVKALRRELHANPEPSEQEVWTKKRLMDFVREHDGGRIVDKGRWFYVVKEEEDAKETIGFRADFDAIVSEDGKAFHGCGHDGHSSILAGLTAYLKDKKTGKNIVYLFQHAEENGAGAKECVEVFDEVKIDRFYGLHNWPNLTKGAPVTCPGTIMCASKGMVVSFNGKQSHASEPEHGHNPAYAIGRLMGDVKELSNFQGYGENSWRGETFESMVLTTIVSVVVGNRGAFGVSPSKGELSMTLRAAKLDDLNRIDEMIRSLAEQYAEEEHLEVSFAYYDEFPDTSNDEKEVERLREIFAKNNIVMEDLPEPIRSSEDFGWYTKKVPGCLFFLGDGDYADLHTTQYEFPEDNLERGIELFATIAMG